MAEEEGFEPSSPGFPVKRFSRPPHSTTLPPLRMGRVGWVFMPTYKKGVTIKGSAGIIWRRDGDSNPRYAFGVYTISNRAPSASSVISPLAYVLHSVHVVSHVPMQRFSSLPHLVRTHKGIILIIFAIFCNLQRNVKQRAHNLVRKHVLLRTIGEQLAFLDQHQTADFGNDVLGIMRD